MCDIRVDDEIVKEVYANNENIKVVDVENGNGIVAIYFSSNALYFPNTKDNFVNTIVKKDRYEWRRNLVQGASRHIFIRDVFKQWYITGANINTNTHEKLYKKLKSLIGDGEKVVTVGVSSGGFAAILYGTWLKANTIFAFSPQISLQYILDTGTEIKHPIVFKYVNDPAYSKYYDLRNIVNFSNNNNLFIFSPLYSEQDKNQLKLLKGEMGVNIIHIKERRHGVPCYGFNLTGLFELDNQCLQQLTSKQWGRIEFSIKIIGLRKTLIALSKMVLKRIKLL